MMQPWIPRREAPGCIVREASRSLRGEVGSCLESVHTAWSLRGEGGICRVGISTRDIRWLAWTVNRRAASGIGARQCRGMTVVGVYRETKEHL
jgi:hypothetical protein